jgi:hypothetical protein
MAPATAPIRGDPSVDGRDPLVTVVYATASSTGVITQAISGPYDLGRPHGGPKSAQGGKTRIPAGGVLPIEAPTHKKAKTKKHKKSTTRHARA